MTQSLLEGAAGDSPGTWRLLDISLTECSAARLEGGDATRPKSANQDDLSIAASFSEGVLGFLVRSSFSFSDADDQLVARIQLGYNARYDVGDQAPSEVDVSKFHKSVLLQLVPFMRELVASTIFRMGLPAFFIPLMRRSEFDVTSSVDSHSSDE